MERLTWQRKEIMKAIEDLHHTSLATLASYLKDKGINISLSTIYRNLESLTNDGLVRSVDIKEYNNSIYEIASISEHDHFICQECNNIIDIPKRLKLKKGSVKKDGNLVYEINVCEYGICKYCLNKYKNS